MSIKERLKAIYHFVKGSIRAIFYKLYVCPKADYTHRIFLNNIRERGEAKVVFIASTLPMWRYQGVLELLKNDNRFKTYVVLCPFSIFSQDQKKESIDDLRSFFDSRNILYYDSTEWTSNQFDLRKWLDPDILFYTQPYLNVYNNLLDWKHYQDKLICYTPYGVGAIAEKWALNGLFHNIAWKLYYETEVYKQDAIRITYNHGRNVVVTGNANADEFLKKDHLDVWRQHTQKKKRIIWAPHFSIVDNLWLHRGSFLFLWDVMLSIAKEYSDSLLFAFKPHPRLKSMLYQLPEWGKERTDNYYNEWAIMSNTQLVETGFVDLFMTSDAMIHDCGSFTVEYHYSQNPVLFTTESVDEIRQQLNELGRAALDAHYIGQNVEDIRHFLNDVVLNGNDPLKSIRGNFFNKYLLPPNGKTVAENMYCDIVESIWN